MSRYLLLLLCLLLLLPFLSSQQLLLYSICETSLNFTANSTYGRNLQKFLSSLTSAVSFSGYLTQRWGQIPDSIDTLVLCRGDAEPSGCTLCVTTACQDVIQLCPNNKGAILFYDLCLFRYSNQRFLDSVDNEQTVLMANIQNATDSAVFKKAVHELLDATANWAVYNSSNRYATGELNKSATHLYTLAQCIPNLSDMNCSRCLRALFEPLPDFLEGKRGGRVLGSVCTMRYEVYSFYEGAPMVKLIAESGSGGSPTRQPAPDARVNPPSTTHPSEEKGGRRKNTAVYIVIPSVTALFVSIACIICTRKRKSSKLLYGESDIDDIDCAESFLFDLSALQDATANFHEENKLGEGGFGEVFKGVLPDGQEIAVKRLAANSWQGLRELKNELVLVSRLQHRNLVRLLGVCLRREKMIVYEFIPNGSLDTFLQDPARREQLHWDTRFRIICGIARGLQYLHDESRLTVVHRDLKASNILLDANMNPKISDFGLARLFLGEQTHKSTSRIVGTFGYMAPEYVMHGQFSVKSDVFSFGVLILEIITGRKSNGFQDEHHADLLSYIWKNWINGTIAGLLDRSTLSDVDWPRSTVLRCIQIGLLCVEENPNDRPNMSTVVLALTSKTVSLQAPSRPAFWTGTRSLEDLNSESFQGRFPRELINHENPSRKMITATSSSTNELTFSEFEPR